MPRSIAVAAEPAAPTPSCPSRHGSKAPRRFAGAPCRELRLDDGQVLLLGKSLATGTSCSVRIARFLQDPWDQPLGVKVVRHKPSDKATNAQGRAPKPPRPQKTLRDECAVAVSLAQSRRDQELLLAEAVWPAQAIPLPTRILGRHPWTPLPCLISDPERHRSYLLSPLYLGDLHSLLLDGPPVRASEAEALVAHVGTQVYLQLALLHDLGIAHLDLKLENVLFARDSAVALADFGHSKPFVADTNKSAVAGLYGTMLAPEMLASANSPLGGLGPATDLFAASGLLLELVAGLHIRSPFQWPRLARAIAADEAAAAGSSPPGPDVVDRPRCAALLAGIASVVADTHEAQIDAPAGEAAPTARAPQLSARSGNATVDAFFNRCFARAPNACAILLTGLATDTTKRPSPVALARQLGAHIAPPESPLAAAVTRRFWQHKNHDHQQTLLRQITIYETLMQAQGGR